MCSVRKKNKNSTDKQNPDYCSIKAHQVHLLCLPVPRVLHICYQSNHLDLREILGHVGKYTLFKEIPKLH